MRLTNALALGTGEIIAIVGGGGKTTAMYRLAREAAEEGRRAVATGTTLFTPPAHRLGARLVVDEPGGALISAIRSEARYGSWLIAAAGHADKGRLRPIAPDVPAAIIASGAVDTVIAEADGSRNRPFKAPGEHEPVIPHGATLVIAVAGMTALGTPLDEEHVHRPERVAGLTGDALGSPVTLEMMAAALAHADGGRKRVPASCRFAVLLNQAEAERAGDARRLAAMLRARGVPLVVVARARDDDPVVEVVT
jgi:probable selenium-dependent hydroxylase accessory protein YqeC